MEVPDVIAGANQIRRHDNSQAAGVHEGMPRPPRDPVQQVHHHAEALHNNQGFICTGIFFSGQGKTEVRCVWQF